MTDRVANMFMLQGIQEWGQSDADRAKATADFLTAAGFKVEPSGYPVFGGMFPRLPITGPDGPAAFEWLDGVLRSLKRGEYNSEVRQLEEAIAARATKAA